ncbi:PREDICTED: shugoshin-1-like isoform X2 [Lupinus angustifolius]|uniref:shugoshin-1-like isoform X2 n=1 Tax=Lupinus angustifolius TaxID=3871 RepID=UPI00092E6008|nr:PREDICTED: shugoshin-1-like isoform X2 [Lupinus angustifolius]
MEGEETKRGKAVKLDSVGVVTSSEKKMLTDITNHLKSPLNQQPKQHSAPIAATSEVSMNGLLKENAMLMQLLANRNAIIESCKAELQKSQTNFQKLQKQNSELALTNSRMLTELNSSRQRFRELQHELGSKNGILKAMKLEAKEHKQKMKHENHTNQAGASQCKKPDQKFQDGKGDNVCHAKRQRVSKSQSSAPVVVKQVKPIGKVDSQRYSLKRQSKAEKPRRPEDDFFEVDEIKYDVLHLQENLANKSEETSLGSKVHEEAREDAECNCTIVISVCYFLMVPILYVYYLHAASGPTNTEQVLAKKNIEKKRLSSRRQSARFKPENLEPAIDSFEIDDAKFAISLLCDDMSEKSVPTSSSLNSGQENVENDGCKFDPREIRRSSVGRPLRQSVVKIQSYKEVPLNFKMRRPT